MDNTTQKNQRSQTAVAISYSRAMARQLNLQEKDLWVLLQGTGISRQQFLDDATLLSGEQQLQLIANAVELSGYAGFGLNMGQSLTPPTHGPLGFLANSSPTLLTAITDFQVFLPARSNITILRTELTERELSCFFDIKIPGREVMYPTILECFSLSLISLIEFVIGKQFREGKLYCSYPKPSYHKDYRDFIHCPIRFNAKESKLTIPAKLLYTPNVAADHRSYEFALTQCQKMLEQLDNSVNQTTNHVRRLLLSHPPGKLSEDAAANLSFISKRTLGRRLEAENSSFRELREEILANLAMDYLKDTDLTVEAIAAILNYHDSSSFRRAFKRWLGKTPQQYREENT